MLEEENQNSKENDETLNLTGKELEEYKKYLKFKNEIEKQNESQEDKKEKSQNITQSQSQGNKSNTSSTMKSFQKEMGTTYRSDPDYTFTEESILNMGYKQYFMKPIDIKPIEKYRNEKIKLIKIEICSLCMFYWGSRNWNGAGWIIFKIIFGIFVARICINAARRLLVTEPISTLKPKINSYNAVIRDAEWVKLSNKDEDFMKYYDIAKDTIKNKLRLIRRKPDFKRYKYTEVYHILNSNIFIVYGIYDSINRYSLGYMIVIENSKCVLNLVSTVVLREKK